MPEQQGPRKAAPTASASGEGQSIVQGKNTIDAATWRVFQTDDGWEWSASVGLSHARGYAESRELAIARAEQACDLFAGSEKPALPMPDVFRGAKPRRKAHDD